MKEYIELTIFAVHSVHIDSSLLEQFDKHIADLEKTICDHPYTARKNGLGEELEKMKAKVKEYRSWYIKEYYDPRPPRHNIE